jgi:peptidylprolyl isomerase
MTLKSLTALIAAAGIGLGVSACGSSTRAAGIMLAPSAGPTNTTLKAVPASHTQTTTAALTVTTPKSGPLSKEPVIKVPSGPPPKHLVIRNLITGTGATAEVGDTIYVNYVGVLYKTGKLFDASWRDTPGKAISFPLSTGSVIPGWVKGLVGMKVGGRRELIIPPALAYGKAGSGSVIPPNSTLIFDVDLLKVVK